jgi:hypothetical protein
VCQRTWRGVDLEDLIAAFFQLVFHFRGLRLVRNNDDTRFVWPAWMSVQDLHSHRKAFLYPLGYNRQFDADRPGPRKSVKATTAGAATHSGHLSELVECATITFNDAISDLLQVDMLQNNGSAVATFEGERPAGTKRPPPDGL